MTPSHFVHGIRVPSTDEVTKLRLVTRQEWGALPANEVFKSQRVFRTIVFAFNTEMDTCTTKDECILSVQTLQKRHMELGHPDIFYNFTIGGDGFVYEGRGWLGRHSASYPVYYGRTLVIGIIGKGKDAEGNWYPPFDLVTKKLIREGINNKLIQRMRQHREDRSKLLPYTPGNFSVLCKLLIPKDEMTDFHRFTDKWL